MLLFTRERVLRATEFPPASYACALGANRRFCPPLPRLLHSERCRDSVPPGVRPSFDGVAMPLGVEQLPKQERFVKAVKAGVDQFGGTEEAQFLVQAVRAGALPESRLDESVYRSCCRNCSWGCSRMRTWTLR